MRKFKSLLTDQPVQVNTKELAEKKIIKVPANQFVSSDRVSADRVKSGQPSLLQNAMEGIKANTQFQSNFFHICLHDSIGGK